MGSNRRSKWFYRSSWRPQKAIPDHELIPNYAETLAVIGAVIAAVGVFVGLISLLFPDH